MRNKNNKLKAGRFIGSILFVIGVILTLLLIYWVTSAKSLPKLLVAGPVFVLLGLGMFLFPGGNVTVQEINASGSEEGVKRLWKDAPILHRVIWIVFGVIGLIIAYKILVTQGFIASI